MKKVTVKKRTLPKGKAAIHSTISKAAYNKVAVVAKKKGLTKSQVLEKAIAGLR